MNKKEWLQLATRTIIFQLFLICDFAAAYGLTRLISYAYKAAHGSP